MTVTSSRLIVVVLLLALGLSACGRSTPGVIAEDGRGGDRPSDTIWIPETRNVDPGPDRRASRDDRDARPEPRAGAAEDRDDTRDPARQTATPAAEDNDEAADPSSGRETSDRTSTPPGGPDTTNRTPSDGTSDPEPADTAPEASEPVEPVEPEAAGDCGARRQEHQPSRQEVERAADHLRVEVAERWPRTHAGVWVTEGARPEVRVAFSEGVRSNLAALCRDFAYPDLLGGVHAAASAEELEQAHARVLAERDELREGRAPEDLPEAIRATGGAYLATIDVPANAIVIVLEEPSAELRSAFRKRYTTQLLIEQGAVDEDDPQEAPPASERGSA